MKTKAVQVQQIGIMPSRIAVHLNIVCFWLLCVFLFYRLKLWRRWVKIMFKIMGKRFLCIRVIMGVHQHLAMNSTLSWTETYFLHLTLSAVIKCQLPKATEVMVNPECHKWNFRERALVLWCVFSDKPTLGHWDCQLHGSLTMESNFPF